MKKVIRSLLIMLVFSLVLSLAAFAEETPISVYLNREHIQFDVEPQIVNGRTMVPIRAIFEKLGASVAWNDKTKTATATRVATTVKITIDEPVMYVNDVEVPLDAPAMIIDSRTLVPLRAVSSAFGCEVGWYGPERTVSLISDNVRNVMLYSKDGSIASAANKACGMCEDGWFINSAMTEKTPHTPLGNKCSLCGIAVFNLNEDEVADSKRIKWMQQTATYVSTARAYDVYFGFSEVALSEGKGIGVPIAVEVAVVNDIGTTVYENKMVFESVDAKRYFADHSTPLDREYYFAIKESEIAVGESDKGTVNVKITNPYVDLSFSEKIEGLPVKQKLRLPAFPQTVTVSGDNGSVTTTVTMIEYEYGTKLLTLKVYGAKTGQTPAWNDMGCTVPWKLYDEKGIVVKSGVINTEDIGVGEWFTVTYEISSPKIEPKKTYTLKIEQ